MLGHSPDQPTGQVDRIRATARTLVADVTTDHTGALTGTAESVVSDSVAGVPGRPGKAETARRWNELVHSYSASGTDNLLYRVPDRIQRPLGPTAHRERARIDALMRRQASVTASIAAGPSAPSAARPSPTPLPSPSPRAFAAMVIGVVSFALWWRLGRAARAVRRHPPQDQTVRV